MGEKPPKLCSFAILVVFVRARDIVKKSQRVRGYGGIVRALVQEGVIATATPKIVRLGRVRGECVFFHQHRGAICQYLRRCLQLHPL